MHSGQTSAIFIREVRLGALPDAIPSDPIGVDSESINGYIIDFIGGASRDRTDDLLNAIQALSQLSYSPNLINDLPLTVI